MDSSIGDRQKDLNKYALQKAWYNVVFHNIFLSTYLLVMVLLCVRQSVIMLLLNSFEQ